MTDQNQTPQPSQNQLPAKRNEHEELLRQIEREASKGYSMPQIITELGLSFEDMIYLSQEIGAEMRQAALRGYGKRQREMLEILIDEARSGGKGSGAAAKTVLTYYKGQSDSISGGFSGGGQKMLPVATTVQVQTLLPADIINDVVEDYESRRVE